MSTTAVVDADGNLVSLEEDLSRSRIVVRATSCVAVAAVLVGTGRVVTETLGIELAHARTPTPVIVFIRSNVEIDDRDVRPDLTPR